MRKTKKDLEKEGIKYQISNNGNRWFGIRVCPKCSTKIEQTALQKCVLIRNLRKLEDSLCLKCSKSRENNPFFGKSHSAETKLKVSKSRTGQGCGQNNAMANPIYRNKVSLALKEKYKSGKLDFLRAIQSKNAIENQANGKLKTAPVSSTEKELIKIFEDLGYIVISQFNIGSLRYDLLLKDKNILIEYNGDYWHCNPSVYHPGYFHKKKQLTALEIWDHDTKKKEIAEKNGYKLFIIWEKDFKFCKENEINKIKENL